MLKIEIVSTAVVTDEVGSVYTVPIDAFLQAEMAVRSFGSGEDAAIMLFIGQVHKLSFETTQAVVNAALQTNPDY